MGRPRLKIGAHGKIKRTHLPMVSGLPAAATVDLMASAVPLNAKRPWGFQTVMGQRLRQR